MTINANNKSETSLQHDRRMQIPDFARSFLTFRIDLEANSPIRAARSSPLTLNSTRMQLEAACQIYDRLTKLTFDFVLGAACKTERVGVESDIWADPNANFSMIMSSKEFLSLRSWDRNHTGGIVPYAGRSMPQPERQYGRVADTFDRIRIDLRMAGAEVLPTKEEVILAVLTNQVLTGRVEYNVADRYDVTLDFPIKVINASERENIYQINTGPIIFPDFSRRCRHLIETFRLAFVAFNTTTWAEFLLQVRKQVSNEVTVNHFAKAVRLTTKNTIFRIG